MDRWSVGKASKKTDYGYNPKFFIFSHVVLWGQTRKSRPNRSTNNGDVIDKAKRKMSELVCDTKQYFDIFRPFVNP